MSEKQQTTQPHRPCPPLMRPASEVIKKGPLSAHEYGTQDYAEQLTGRLQSLIVKGIQSVEGPLYVIEDSYKVSFAPFTSLLKRLHNEGIIAKEQFVLRPPHTDEPKLFIVGLPHHIDPTKLLASTVGEISHAGVSFDFSEAAAKAIGEFLERYALLPWTQYASYVASPADLQKRGASVIASELICQPDVILDTAYPIRWVKGRRLPDNASCMLPAQSAWWGYNPALAHEPLFREPNTNGAAGMYDLSGAILHGLRELIQRDAFLLFWLTRTAPPRIEIPSIPDEEVQDILTKMHRYRLGVELLNITSDIGLPAFAAVIMDGEGEEKKIAVGAGCQADPMKALTKALTEALGVFHIGRTKKPYTLPQDYKPFSDPSFGQEERMRLWANPALFPKAMWFLKGSVMSWSQAIRPFPSLLTTEEELAFCIKACSRLAWGGDVYYYEARLPILSVLKYHVVKVIVPGLLPLYLDEIYAPLAHPRLAGRPSLNALPHPLT